ncbi:MAG: tol-pal system YbgF family protein [Mariniblastus sp.]
MNQKAATNKKNKFGKQEVVEEEVELTGLDKFLEDIKPHLTTIGLVAVAAFLGFLLIAFMMQNSFQATANQWRDLNTSTAVALRTSDLKGWQKVASDYPDSQAGLWALQLAGDRQLGTGLEQFAADQEGGLSLVKMAKENFQKIVDSTAPSKTTMLQRRSVFSLAYACESLGEFENAKKLYEQLVEEAPDSAFAESALRGIKRTSNPEFAALYTKLTNWEEEVGDAPGPAVPEKRPSIDFPETDFGPGVKPADKPESETIKNQFVPPVKTESTESTEKADDSPATPEKADSAPVVDPETETKASETEKATDEPPAAEKKEDK